MQFSTRSMKNMVDDQTDKRVSNPSADHIGEILEEYAQSRAKESLERAQDQGRKTVTARDLLKTRDHSPRSYEYDIPKAPVERIIREAGAERVSQEAILVLKQEVIAQGMQLARKSDDMADHARRKTIKKSDVELARY